VMINAKENLVAWTDLLTVSEHNSVDKKEWDGRQGRPSYEDRLERYLCQKGLYRARSGRVSGGRYVMTRIIWADC
jgi:hypothetical protein